MRGEVALNGRSLSAGDGAAIEDETELAIEGLAQPSEVLLFDMSRRGQVGQSYHKPGDATAS